jgi:hypothetical protein
LKHSISRPVTLRPRDLGMTSYDNLTYSDSDARIEVLSPQQQPPDVNEGVQVTNGVNLQHIPDKVSHSDYRTV